MKSLLRMVGVILVWFAIFSGAKAWGADWRLYFNDSDAQFYYDKESITNSSENIVSVWVREKLTREGIDNAVRALGGKYADLSYLRILYEINCRDKKISDLAFSFYSEQGFLINSKFNNEKQWNFIMSGSMGDFLYRAVCK